MVATLDRTGEALDKYVALNELRKPFRPDQVKQRTQNGVQLDYISIDATINRLLDVLDTDWSFETGKTQLDLLPEGIVDRRGNRQYLAVVEGTLQALGSYHSGVGSDIASDPDKALKTALAEALKKAGHQLGIGLYLWDADERDLLAVQRAADGGDIDALKSLVYRRALTETERPDLSPAEVADHFNVAVETLNDAGTLTRLLIPV